MEAHSVKHLVRVQSWDLKHNFLTPSLLVFAGSQHCLTEGRSAWEKNAIFKTTSEERIEGLGRSKRSRAREGFAGRQKVAQESRFT